VLLSSSYPILLLPIIIIIIIIIVIVTVSPVLHSSHVYLPSIHPSTAGLLLVTIFVLVQFGNPFSLPLTPPFPPDLVSSFIISHLAYLFYRLSDQ